MRCCCVHCRRVTACKKPRAKGHSSSAALEDKSEHLGQEPVTSAKALKGSTSGRRRAPRKVPAKAAVDNSSQSAGVPAQADSDQDGGLAQDNVLTVAGVNPAAASDQAAKPKRAPRRRRALAKVAPVSQGSEVEQQIGRPEASKTTCRSASSLSEAPGTSPQGLLQSRALSGGAFASSHCNADGLRPIAVEPRSRRSVACHVSSAASEGLGGTAAAYAGQPWAAPDQDAWCYITSSPELSMQPSPQLAAHLISSFQGSQAQLPGDLSPSSVEAPVYSPGHAKVHARSQGFFCGCLSMEE